MYKIKQGKAETIIELTRGDTLKFKLNLKKGDDIYEPEDGDVIEFGLKKSVTDTDCIFTKTVAHTDMTVHIRPEDTKSLDYSTYVWDIQITYANGDVYTFLKGTLSLTSEVV